MKKELKVNIGRDKEETPQTVKDAPITTWLICEDKYGDRVAVFKYGNPAVYRIDQHGARPQRYSKKQDPTIYERIMGYKVVKYAEKVDIN